MRTLPPAFQAEISREVVSLCRLLTITTRTGASINLTTASESIVVDGIHYRADVGFDVSGIFLGTNVNSVQGFTITMPLLADVITKMDIKKRKYYGATVEVHECARTSEPAKFLLYSGVIADVTFADVGIVSIDVKPRGSRLTNIGGEIYSQTCRYNLGDDNCKFPIESWAVDFTITQVLNQSDFVVDTFGAIAEGLPDQDFYSQGQLIFKSGSNKDWALDINSSVTSTRTVSMMYAPPDDMAVGDTGRMYPGCSRYATTCRDRYNNILNFGGFPFATNWM